MTKSKLGGAGAGWSDQVPRGGAGWSDQVPVGGAGRGGVTKSRGGGVE